MLNGKSVSWVYSSGDSYHKWITRWDVFPKLGSIAPNSPFWSCKWTQETWCCLKEWMKERPGLIIWEDKKISLYHILYMHFPLKTWVIPLIISILLYKKYRDYYVCGTQRDRWQLPWWWRNIRDFFWTESG